MPFGSREQSQIFQQINTIMTTQINTADPIGILDALEKFPHITGSGIRLLQVEYIRNKAWSPEAAIATPVSSHAVQVQRRIREIAPGLGPILAWEANAYIRDSLRAQYTFPPLPADWDIECHAYGNANPSVNQAIAKMAERVERDNVLVVVAHPNSTSEITLPLWFRSDHVLVVGGSDKDFGWTTWGKKVRVPHIRGAHKDSSIACAEVAAVAALVVQAIRATGVTAHWSVVRKVLVNSAQNGAVNAARALERVLGAPAVEIQPPAEPETPEQSDDTAPEVVVPDPVKPVEVAPPPEPTPEPVDRYAIIRREAEVITQEKGGGYLYDDEECERLIAAVDRQREAWAQEGANENP